MFRSLNSMYYLYLVKAAASRIERACCVKLSRLSIADGVVRFAAFRFDENDKEDDEINDVVVALLAPDLELI